MDFELSGFAWFCISIIVGVIATRLGRRFWVYFLLSFLLTPVVSIIILLIKGKVTKDELFDKTPHIFYCRNCDAAYYGDSFGKSDNCPSCHNPTFETEIPLTEWRTYSPEKKESMRKAFAAGYYLRNANSFKTTAPVPGAAEELRQYKELLDADIINQEEFDAKKRQLLNL